MRIIEEILAACAQITAEQIEQVTSTFPPVEKGETVLCVVQSDAAKRLWALAHHYDRMMHTAQHVGRFEAITKGQRDLYGHVAARARYMEEVVRDLAWMEIRLEADEQEWNGCVALREGFTLVSSQPDEEPSASRVAVAQLPAEFAQLLERAIRRKFGQEDEDPPPKPPKPH